MKRTTLAIFAAIVSLGLSAGSLRAQPAPNGARIQGSGALSSIMQGMLAQCPGAGTLSYLGSGADAGEAAMLSSGATQYLAPMGRFHHTSSWNLAGYEGNVCTGTVEGYNFGLHAVSMVRRQSNTVGCDTLAHTSTITVGASTYTFRDFRDVLSIVYGGFDHSAGGATAACATDEPYGLFPAAAQNCNSALRQAIVNNWGNLFQNPSCGSGESCTQLRHAFRPDDASAATDTFAALLGLPDLGPSGKTFCNGKDDEDKDPIRRPCAGTGSGTSGGEQVCEPREATALAYPANNTIPLGPPSTPWEPAVNNQGDLGVVLPIKIPASVPSNVAHNTNACNFGAFDLVHMPSALQLAGTRCPNGTPQVVLKCLWPKDASGNYGCLNPAVNSPTIGELKHPDGRVYNLILRSGNNRDDNIVKDSGGKLVTGAFYRLHETKVMAGSGGVPCQTTTASYQIGCLVQASPCSVGFGGLETVYGDALALKLGTPDNTAELQPSDATIQRLGAVDPNCTGGVLASRYPLARRLWLNSLGGFGDPNMPADQQALAGCFRDRGYVDAILRSNGSTPLPEPAGLAAGQTCQMVGPGNPSCQVATTSALCL
ncbi:MAG TPA: hypothetical protein VF331_23575 [Polyangiales bacterium]